MHPRLTHLRLEDLESRLVAGSYFGGPTGSGGLAAPWPAFLGRAATQPPAYPAAATSQPAGSAQGPETAGSPARPHGSGEPGSSRQDRGLGAAPLRPALAALRAIPETTAAPGDPDASLVLNGNADLTTGLEPPSRTAHGRQAALGGAPPVTGADTAALNVSGQTGGVGSVA